MWKDEIRADSHLPVFYNSVYKRVDFLDPVNVSLHYFHAWNLEKQHSHVCIDHIDADVNQSQCKPQTGKTSLHIDHLLSLLSVLILVSYREVLENEKKFSIILEQTGTFCLSSILN